MNNIIILGCPRSGTSMTAGLFKNSKHFMGDLNIDCNETDPEGLYEWRVVNDINEEIIKQSLDNIEKPYDTYFLTPISSDAVIKADEKIISKIKKLTNKPFCYKDPRFSYTLPIWKPYLGDCRFIVVFREPVKVIISMQKLAKKWYNMTLSKETCINIWKSYNEHILRMFDDKNWLFLHFNQLFEKSVYAKIKSHTQVDALDESHPKREHMRNYISEGIPECREIYEKLCKLAGYNS